MEWCVGEAPLHMAIVNQKPSFVRFLLFYGADVHQRCFGKFFCCDDQRSLRTNYIDDELFGIPEETNYMSTNPYLGEYPLSFAAVLNQEESLRLLMAKKADPDMQDSNGNTALHMLVIYNNLVCRFFQNTFGSEWRNLLMFCWILENVPINVGV